MESIGSKIVEVITFLILRGSAGGLAVDWRKEFFKMAEELNANINQILKKNRWNILINDHLFRLYEENNI